MSTKIPKNAFSTLHLNISSLQGHIDDLKTLLSLLNHKFSVIGISETRIRDGSDPLLNIDIDGYMFLRGWVLKLRVVGWVFIYEAILIFHTVKNLVCQLIMLANLFFVIYPLLVTKRYLLDVCIAITLH